MNEIGSGGRWGFVSRMLGSNEASLRPGNRTNVVIHGQVPEPMGYGGIREAHTIMDYDRERGGLPVP